MAVAPGADQTRAEGIARAALAPADRWTVGEFEGRYDAATGKITFRDLAAVANGELQTATFGERTRSLSALHFVNGSATAANVTCGDTANGIPDQPNSFCADVSIANGSNRPYGLVWAEFFAIDSGYTIAMGTPDTVGSTYTNYLSNSIGALAFGDISNGGSTLRKVVFRTGGSTANFTFKVRVKAAPTRQEYEQQLGNSTFTNACDTGTVMINGGTNGTGASSASVVAPWPLTIFNKSSTRFTVNTEGVLYFSNTPITVGGNAALPTTSYPAGSAFVFWDQQRVRGSNETSDPHAGTNAGRICRQTVGTYPSRVLTVTWENMRMGSATNFDSDLVYSMSFYEADDSIEYRYKIMHDLSGTWPSPLTTTNFSQSNRVRGKNTTIGFQGTASGSPDCINSPDTSYCLQASVLGTVSPLLPLKANSDYPFGAIWTPVLSN